eukprot:5824571-Pyramimonas_sp.AAC.1
MQEALQKCAKELFSGAPATVENIKKEHADHISRMGKKRKTGEVGGSSAGRTSSAPPPRSQAPATGPPAAGAAQANLNHAVPHCSKLEDAAAEADAEAFLNGSQPASASGGGASAARKATDVRSRAREL